MSDESKPVAWMRADGETGSLTTMVVCISDKVKQVWLKMNPRQVERYTIPLYMRPSQEEVELELARRKGDPCTRLHNICQALQDEKNGSTYGPEEWDRLSGENDDLRAQLAAAQKDAERYRWLRQFYVSGEHLDGSHAGKVAFSGDREGLDSIIDAAMGASDAR